MQLDEKDSVRQEGVHNPHEVPQLYNSQPATPENARSLNGYSLLHDLANKIKATSRAHCQGLLFGNVFATLPSSGLFKTCLDRRTVQNAIRPRTLTQ